jgi:ATP-dependent DNA ligase
MEDEDLIPYYYPNKPNRIDPELVSNYEKPNWIAERKKNGWRCLAIREPEKLDLWTSSHRLFPNPLPITREALAGLPPMTVIDGEMQNNRTKDIKDLFYAFDILMWEGKWLFGQPWRSRRALLELATRDIEGILVSVPIHTGKKMLYQMAIEEGDEGIVMKELDSTYLIATKGTIDNPLWIKAKQPENCMRT